MTLIQVNNNEIYWEFIRTLRNDERVAHGFIQKSSITKQQQAEYMTLHGHTYFIIFEDSIPIGYIGDVERDIRICISPEFQNQGYGTKAIQKFHEMYPNSLAKIKIDNKQSLKAFENAGYKIEYFLMSKK
jgi:RimJ/RimL family protein N-acetyltransferase